MRAHTGQVSLGARIPTYLKEKLAEYCLSHGIKMSYFVAEAIKEKLLEIAADRGDLVIAEERLKSAKFTSQKGFEKYLYKRGIKS